jgi:hypothetical protein
MQDKTEFRIGRSHDDIVYHHVAGRDHKLDPRYAVCQSAEEADLLVRSLNYYVDVEQAYTEYDFQNLGLRW